MKTSLTWLKKEHKALQTWGWILGTPVQQQGLFSLKNVESGYPPLRNPSRVTLAAVLCVPQHGCSLSLLYKWK